MCGVYLCWLGYRAVTAKRLQDWIDDFVPREPLRRGLAFGLSNPKAYPVAVAMFTALLAEHAAALDWTALPALLGRRVRGVHHGRRHPGHDRRRGACAALVQPARACGSRARPA